MEVLKGDKTINEIASEYIILFQRIFKIGKIYFSKCCCSYGTTKAVKEYKDEIEKLKAKMMSMQKIVGKLTVENNWMSGKVKKSLDSKKTRYCWVQAKWYFYNKTKWTTRCCKEWFVLSSKNKWRKLAIKQQIQAIYNEIPIYGYLKVHKQLLEDGFIVSPNTVQKYRKDLGLKLY